MHHCNKTLQRLVELGIQQYCDQIKYIMFLHSATKGMNQWSRNTPMICLCYTELDETLAGALKPESLSCHDLGLQQGALIMRAEDEEETIAKRCEENSVSYNRNQAAQWKVKSSPIFFFSHFTVL